MTNKTKRIALLVLCLIIPLALGLLSSFLSGDIRGMYEGLNKPPLAPPGWLFGIVWPVLYILMGIALYLVLSAKGGLIGAGSANKDPGIKRAAVVFALQLLLNFFWSIVFFNFAQYWLSVGIIVLMDIAVLICVILFYRIKKASGLLMLPYLLWILFATYLSIAFAVLN